jgi:hypothetical protein
MTAEAASSFRYVSVLDVLTATPRLIVQTTAPGVSIRDANLSNFTERRRGDIGRELLALMYHGCYIERMFQPGCWRAWRSGAGGTATVSTASSGTANPDACPSRG